MSSGAASDAAPPAGGSGVVAAVDAAIARVERWLVTVIALVMTTTVFLDIVFRAFGSPESQLAQKAVRVLSWFGVEPTTALYETLRDRAVPVVLIGLAFFAGWAVLAATRRRQERSVSKGALALAGVASVIGCVAFVEFVVRVESWLVCAVLLGAGCLGYLAYAVQKREWIGAVLSVVVGGVGVSLCLKLPPQYIWSQELSLILLAWLAFIGASMATRADKHIQVDAFARIIPRGLRPWSRALGLLVTTVFCVYITLLAYEHVFGPRGDYISGETRPATGIPGWTIIFAVVVAFGLMSLRFGARTVDAFLHPRVPDREVSH